MCLIAMNSSQSPVECSPDPRSNYHSGIGEGCAFLRVFVHSLFPLMICASLSLGWWVPAFYDWSGDDQSRSPPIVGYVLTGFLIACLLSLVALPLLPKVERMDPVHSPLIRPFGFRGILFVVVAMTAGLLVFDDATIVLIGVAAVLYPLVCAVKLGLMSRSLRWRIMSLYSCLYLPFVWICAEDTVQNQFKQGAWTFLPLLAGAPALLVSLIIRQLAGRHNELMLMVGVTVVGLEILAGLWIVQLGARRAAAYQILLLAVSVITSYGFLGMLRA